MAMFLNCLAPVLVLAHVAWADDFLARRGNVTEALEGANASARAGEMAELASHEPGHPMADCCCSCPHGFDRYCSPRSGNCYTERVHFIKPYYDICYGPEAPRACPAGAQQFPWWWKKYTQYEFMDCSRVASQVSEKSVRDVEECGMYCDSTPWCRGFSISPSKCWLLGEFWANSDRCDGPTAEEFGTWSINTWSRNGGPGNA